MANLFKRKILLYIFFTFILINLSYSQQNLKGWNINGQTFLKWNHIGIIPKDTIYDIYRSSNPITSLTQATKIGTVFAGNGENTRISDKVPDARWKLPDSLIAGTMNLLSANQAYFVSTTYSATTSYYAVVLKGNTVINSGNICGPILEMTDTIQCYIQYQDADVTIYSHWVDGRKDYENGLADYPVMGNEHGNGMGFNFAVWEPAPGRPSGKLPVVCALHGGYQNLFFLDIPSTPFISGNYVPNGLFITFDDGLEVQNPIPDSIGVINTFWYGYSNTYNRFNIPVIAGNSDTIVNYTARRLWWETTWLRNNETIDTNRVSLIGFSMGAVGTLLHSQLRQDLYSSAIAYVPILNGIKGLLDPWRIWGTYGQQNQNLLTNITGHPTIYNLLDQSWRFQQQNHENWPFTITVCGKKNDDRARWSQNYPVLLDLDTNKSGFSSYWDDRFHTDFSNAYFKLSEKIKIWPLTHLTNFRKDQSFPGFSKTDIDIVTPDQQPDIGNGDSLNGAPWGSHGGYISWNLNSIVDTPTNWEVSLWIVGASTCTCDIANSDTIRTYITPKRLQNFIVTPNANYYYELIKLSNSSVLQSGIVQADNAGIVTIPDLSILKDTVRLVIQPDLTSVATLPETNDIRIYPNPTTKQFTVYGLEAVAQDMIIYNVFGELVSSESATGQAGVYGGQKTVNLDVPGGIYFLHFKNEGGVVVVKKLVVY